MARWTTEPEAAALALIAGTLSAVDLGDSVLLAGGDPALATHVETPSRKLVRWTRRVAPFAFVQPDPPAEQFASALLRLPKSRNEQLMTAHQCLGTLAPTGRLIVYGGNDEGIRSFAKTLSGLGPVETLAARGHGRVLELRRQAVTERLAPQLADWRRQSESVPTWISYPGLFAGGEPDPGTGLLLAHLSHVPAGARVLDYGAGPGAISAAIRRADPAAPLTLLDNDSVALAAAAENVDGAELVLGDSLAAVKGATFDVIVSNPPLHVGFKEDTSALLRLVSDAPRHLTAQGVMLLVVQRRIALDRALSAVFPSVTTLADDGRYRIWRAAMNGRA